MRNTLFGSKKFEKLISEGSAGPVIMYYEPEAVAAVIDYIYLDRLPLMVIPKSLSICLDITQIAIEFGLAKLLDFCMFYVKKLQINVDNAKQLYKFAIVNHIGDEIELKWWEYYRE